MKMKIMNRAVAVLALAAFSIICVSGARADDWNKKTVMTFSQPVEIPGQVLPAGTYTIKLVDLAAERHVVQFLSADGTQVIATVLAINNWRLHPTGETVVKFAERSGDNPEALKAWFYPGDNFGQEFVYPKQRAIQLAIEAKEPIPAFAEETPAPDLKTAPITAVTPDNKEVPVAEVIATDEPATADAAPAAAPVEVAQETTLPKTASMLPLIALLGLVSVGCAFVVKRYAV
jgi:hypothetical protein